MKKKWFVVFGIVLLVLIGAFFIYKYFFIMQGDFSKTSLIRMNLPLGGEINSTIKISNSFDEPKNIEIYFGNLESFAFLSDTEFSLESGESKQVTILFKDTKGIPGIYVGKVFLDNGATREEIPVVLGVEDPNHAFAIIQSSVPKYDSASPGGKFGVDLKVFDLINSGAQTVPSTFFVKNFDDEVLLSGAGDLIVGTGSKTEIVNIPRDWKEGNYVFISYINYKNTLSFSGYIFTVSNPESVFDFNNPQFFLIAVAVLIVLIIILIIYFIFTRDSLLIQLKRQHVQEIKRNVNYINDSKKAVSKSKDKPEKKKRKIRKLENLKKKILKKIKDRQEKQKKEISHMKKKRAKKTAVKNKINKWKKESERNIEAEPEVKKVTGRSVQSKIKEWNQRGFEVNSGKK